VIELSENQKEIGPALDFNEDQIAHDMSPRTLSEWLELAVADLRRIADKSGFAVNMGVFYLRSRLNPVIDQPDFPAEVCQVCLAGAVLVGAGVAPIVERDLFNDVGAETRILLQAINHLRMGQLTPALRELRHPNRFILDSTRSQIREVLASEPDLFLTTVSWNHRKPASYQQPFYDSMDRVLAKLKELGI
jgi:hypothetical protein